MKVSIIVAAYNEERLLSRCLDSLVLQSLQKDFEVIIVNDGSIDATASICEAYKKAYPTIIKVIHKHNEGQGYARNDGIKIATGEYIGFVDADDWVSHEMFERMYQRAIKDQADVVVCDVHKIYEDTQIETKENSLPTNNSPIDIGIYIKEGKDNAYSCNKLFKRHIWENYQFKNMVYEDLEVILTILSHSKIVSYVQEAFYHYFKHEGSTTTSYTNPRLFDILFAYQSACLNASKQYKNEVCFCVAKRILINLETPGFKYYRAELIELIHTLMPYFKDNTLIKDSLDINKIITFEQVRVIPNHLIFIEENHDIDTWKNYSHQASLFPVKKVAHENKMLNQIELLNCLYKYGGILIDKDIKLQSPYGSLRSYQSFIVFGSGNNLGIMGFIKHHPFIKDLINKIEHDLIFDLSFNQIQTLLKSYDGIKQIQIDELSDYIEYIEIKKELV